MPEWWATGTPRGRDRLWTLPIGPATVVITLDLRTGRLYARIADLTPERELRLLDSASPYR